MDFCEKYTNFSILIVPQNIVAVKWFGKDFAEYRTSRL